MRTTLSMVDKLRIYWLRGKRPIKIHCLCKMRLLEWELIKTKIFLMLWKNQQFKWINSKTKITRSKISEIGFKTWRINSEKCRSLLSKSLSRMRTWKMSKTLSKIWGKLGINRKLSYLRFQPILKKQQLSTHMRFSQKFKLKTMTFAKRAMTWSKICQNANQWMCKSFFNRLKVTWTRTNRWSPALTCRLKTQIIIARNLNRQIKSCNLTWTNWSKHSLNYKGMKWICKLKLIKTYIQWKIKSSYRTKKSKKVFKS